MNIVCVAYKSCGAQQLYTVVLALLNVIMKAVESSPYLLLLCALFCCSHAQENPPQNHETNCKILIHLA